MIETTWRGRTAPAGLARPERHNAVFEPALDPETDHQLNEVFERCRTSSDFAGGRPASAQRRAPVFEGR